MERQTRGRLSEQINGRVSREEEEEVNSGRAAVGGGGGGGSERQGSN